MGSFSNYAELKILDHVTGKAEFTMPTAWVALCTADPTETGTGDTITEPAGNGYTRMDTTSGDWNAAADGTISNANDITFPEATGDWGTITHFAICDATVSGNMLAYAALDTTKSISSGDTAKFAAGYLKIALD